MQGSDLAESANVKRLREMGAKIAIGHAAENRDGPSRGGLLRDQARQSRAGGRARAPAAGGAPRRNAGRTDAAEVRVAIAGTHGKTTTTSMVAALLDAGGFDPTVINGGIINAYGTNAGSAPATGWWSRPTNPTAPS